MTIAHRQTFLRKAVACLATLFFMAACATTPATRSTNDTAALAAFGDNWRAAYEVGDFDALAELYEPDAWLMAADKPARKGIDEIMTYFRTARAAGAKASIVFVNESRSVDGDYAFETAHWWLEFPREGKPPVRSSGRSLLIFKRSENNQWRVWRDIDNHTPDVKYEDRPQ